MTSPRCCGIFNRPVVFTALLSFAVFNYFGVQGPYTTGILTTLQREFKFKSSEVGFLLTVNDIVGLIVVTPLAYLGAKSHRPRIIGILMVIFSIGCFVSAIPQFVGGGDDGLKNDTDPMLMKEPQVFLCEDDVVDDDDTCSAAEEAASGAQYSRAIWLFLGQALCGIGGAGFFPLGITYIDDGVPKSSSSVHVGKCFIWLPWLHSLTRSSRRFYNNICFLDRCSAVNILPIVHFIPGPNNLVIPNPNPNHLQ